jgi:hypothetical protein
VHPVRLAIIAAAIFVPLIALISAPNVSQAATVCWGTESAVSPADERRLKRAVKTAFDRATRTKPGVVHTSIGVEALCGIDMKVRYVYVYIGFNRNPPRHSVYVLIDNVERFAVDDQFLSSATYDIYGRRRTYSYEACAWESSFDCHGGGPDFNPVPSGNRREAGTKITRFMSDFAGQLLRTLNTNVPIRR